MGGKRNDRRSDWLIVQWWNKVRGSLELTQNLEWNQWWVDLYRIFFFLHSSISVQKGGWILSLYIWIIQHSSFILNYLAHGSSCLTRLASPGLCVALQMHPHHPYMHKGSSGDFLSDLNTEMLWSYLTFHFLFFIFCHLKWLCAWWEERWNRKGWGFNERVGGKRACPLLHTELIDSQHPPLGNSQQWLSPPWTHNQAGRQAGSVFQSTTVPL